MKTSLKAVWSLVALVALVACCNASKSKTSSGDSCLRITTPKSRRNIDVDALQNTDNFDQCLLTCIDDTSRRRGKQLEACDCVCNQLYEDCLIEQELSIQDCSADLSPKASTKLDDISLDNTENFTQCQSECIDGILDARDGTRTPKTKTRRRQEACDCICDTLQQNDTDTSVEDCTSELSTRAISRIDVDSLEDAETTNECRLECSEPRSQTLKDACDCFCLNIHSQDPEIDQEELISGCLTDLKTKTRDRIDTELLQESDDCNECQITCRTNTGKTLTRKTTRNIEACECLCREIHTIATTSQTTTNVMVTRAVTDPPATTTEPPTTTTEPPATTQPPVTPA